MPDFEKLTQSTHLGRVRIGSTIARIVRGAGNRAMLIPVAVFTMMETGLLILSAGGTGRLIDAVVASDRQQMLAAALFIALSEIAKALVILVKDAACGQYLEPALATMKRKTVEALGRARISWLDRQHSGDLSAKINSDLTTLASALRPVMIFGVCEILALAGLTAYLLAANLSLSLVTLALVPSLLGIQWITARPIQRHSQAAQRSVGEIGVAAGDAFTALETIKSFGLEGHMAARMDDAQKRHVKAVRRYSRVEATMVPVSLLTRALPFFILLIAGGRSVIQGSLSFGDLAAFLLVAEMALPKFAALSDTISGLRHMAASGSRIMELWDAPRERTDGEVLEPEKDAVDGEILEFCNVSFAYDPACPVLSGVTFTVRRGETVALAGESGCGKSTVLRLASAMYASDSGEVLLFGKTESDWCLAALRTHLSYATQDPFLLDESLYENIACSRKTQDHGGAGRDVVRKVIGDVGLGPFVDDLPKGMDTPAGELGAYLSGGQRQRVALARALYRGAPLLLLDEAASSLDGPSEAALLRLLSQLPERPAILTVAHRLSSIRHADRILMMKGGMIAEQGTYDELMAAGGLFADLVALQAQEVEA